MKLLPEEMVLEFHQIFGAAINENPTPELTELRRKLIREEYNELMIEFNTLLDTNEIHDNFVKELADLQYVISGLAITYGIDLNEAVFRVHESNLSKLGEDGKPIYREDKKVLKGPNYFEPNMKGTY